MSICNYCSFKERKAKSKVDGSRLIKRSANWGMGGVNIYRISKTETIPPTIIEACEQYPNGDKFHQEHFICWYMKLPTTCEC